MATPLPFASLNTDGSSIGNPSIAGGGVLSVITWENGW